jgi:hypothetical protein
MAGGCQHVLADVGTRQGIIGRNAARLHVTPHVTARRARTLRGAGEALHQRGHLALRIRARCYASNRARRHGETARRPRRASVAAHQRVPYARVPTEECTHSSHAREPPGPRVRPPTANNGSPDNAGAGALASLACNSTNTNSKTCCPMMMSRQADCSQQTTLLEDHRENMIPLPCAEVCH